ncbi:PREDICTED: uncharacterized protein LOC107073527 [Polistes dominula]|uniref:Uncharacterized protein LOC107073527 n=1 Tax=Polistes dominula TaxID=743375 RepID=A0ABM1JB64_POLDO|nr:PREDICTED: uncharacterized protein LOC107073527 [Polistes dominula]
MMIYAAAITTTQQNKQQIPEETPNNQQKTINYHKKPKWQIRVEQKIHTIRKDIGRLKQAIKGNMSKNITKYINTLLDINNNNYTVNQLLDTHKQKLAVYAARLKRYNESYKRKIENTTFLNSERTFYRKLNTEQEIGSIQPTKKEITTFWTQIWSNTTEHNTHATWITDEKQKYEDMPEQAEYRITEDELKKTIRSTHNWKHPEPDHIQNFWYKKFTTTHPYLTQQINKIIEDPQELPRFLTEGITFTKPKNQNTENSANYRPITCLPTLYKIITSTICRQIDTHLTKNNIISEEQKGCRRNSQGCKEQLIIDSIIMNQAKKQQRNLHTCYIDYKKAFDSVPPHTWLIEILKIYKINKHTQQFLKHTMSTWRTRIILKTPTDTIRTEEIKIKKGIFQGDTLSALWFNMCLNPLSTILNNSKYGFQIRNIRQTQYTINHLMYVDDRKLYAATETQLNTLLKITENFTSDIKMQFGIDKCKTTHIERGQWITDDTQRTLQNETLQNLEKHETYKYLGFEQNTKINHTEIKKYLQKQYNQRLTKILKTKLNSKNLVKAINHTQ